MSFESTSRKALFALACCSLILGACAAYDPDVPRTQADSAPPAPARELTEAEKIIARHVEAVGGEDAIRAYASRTIKGGFEMPAMGMSGDATQYAMAPDKTLALISLPGMGEIVNGVNGDVAWAEDPMQGPRVLDGDMLADAKRQARFYADLEYDALYPQQSAAGETEWNGQTAHQLDLVDTDGNDSTRYFAADTGLLIGIEQTQINEMGTMDMTITLGDYMEFGGILLPTSTVFSMPSMGMEFTQTVESVTFDDVDPSVFEPSDAIKALLPE